MAVYLVVHAPKPVDEGTVRAPSRLADLARASTEVEAWPRWVKTWSPDLHDDRIFSLWEARDAAEIVSALEHFGFLDDMTAEPLRVREWGLDEVLAVEG